ncbi:Transcriptional regulatory protein BtsR [bioreactor metagenome]|uniref:Transcriptional regulatory protein BtsR n=1 Tax=bioreactor metagenome TaxID=1076179 RepID=A0A644W7P5_9ZZZZ
MMNCIIIDDEPLAVELMADNVSKVSSLNLVATCTSPAEAIGVLNEKQIDLIFLDIEMPDITGVSFLKSLKVKPMVIFTTAYDKYAIEGFDLDVVDYLLKPISFERFLKAVNKAMELHSMNSGLKTIPEIDRSKHIFVKSEHKILKIDLADILYIESMKDYVKIYCGAKPVFSLMSMKQIEALLPQSEFVRIHRSFIVALAHIDFIGKSKVVIGSESLPISGLYREDFFKHLGGNFSNG